jgi:hypothetical protein
MVKADVQLYLQDARTARFWTRPLFVTFESEPSEYSGPISVKTGGAKAFRKPPIAQLKIVAQILKLGLRNSFVTH